MTTIYFRIVILVQNIFSFVTPAYTSKAHCCVKKLRAWLANAWHKARKQPRDRHASLCCYAILTPLRCLPTSTNGCVLKYAPSASKCYCAVLLSNPYRFAPRSVSEYRQFEALRFNPTEKCEQREGSAHRTSCMMSLHRIHRLRVHRLHQMLPETSVVLNFAFCYIFHVKVNKQRK